MNVYAKTPACAFPTTTNSISALAHAKKPRRTCRNKDIAIVRRHLQTCGSRRAVAPPPCHYSNKKKNTHWRGKGHVVGVNSVVCHCWRRYWAMSFFNSARFPSVVASARKAPRAQRMSRNVPDVHVPLLFALDAAEGKSFFSFFFRPGRRVFGCGVDTLVLLLLFSNACTG